MVFLYPTWATGTFTSPAALQCGWLERKASSWYYSAQYAAVGSLVGSCTLKSFSPGFPKPVPQSSPIQDSSVFVMFYRHGDRHKKPENLPMVIEANNVDPGLALRSKVRITELHFRVYTEQYT